MTIHSEGITDADLDRFEKVAEPIYRSTATAGEASRFQVSDLGMWVLRLVAEVRRLRAGTDAPADERGESKQELCDRCGWALSGHVRSQYGLDCPPGGSRPGFRRSEVPEPSVEAEFAPGECDGSGTCSASMHIHGCYTRHRADQCDAPEEYGHLPSEPQGEPSDAQLEAAQVAMRQRGLIVSRLDMRAALRAAGGVR